MRVTQIIINEHANVVIVHLDGPMGPVWREFVGANFTEDDIAKFLSETIRIYQTVSKCRSLYCGGAVILPFVVPQKLTPGVQ